MKTCTVCKQNLSYDYYHRSKQTKDGYGYRCKDCDKKARLKYQTENKERFKEINRNKLLKNRYGISLDEYNTMLEQQNYSCKICGSKDSSSPHGSANFAVDHCHETGSVRGLLCNQCNRGLGLFKDSTELLLKSINYLKEFDTH